MIVQINYNEGGDNSNELIEIEKKDYKKLEKIVDKYTKEGCPTFFIEYLVEKKFNFKKIIPDEIVEV